MLKEEKKETLLQELQWRKQKLLLLNSVKNNLIQDLKDIELIISEYTKQFHNIKQQYQKVCQHINIIGTPLTPAFIQHDRFCLDCGLHESLLYKENSFKILQENPLQKLKNTLTYKEFDDIVLTENNKLK